MSSFFVYFLGLMYIANDETITAGVFDSPFSNFMKLAAEIG